MKSTKQATAYLRRFRTINNGGCLIAAYAFYMNEKRAGRDENLKLVALAFDRDSYIRANEKFINGKSKKATSSCHFGWTYNDGETVFDVDGEVIRFGHNLVIPKEATEIFAIASLNAKQWNSTFNRAKIVPKIAKYFDLDFSKVDQPDTTGWW